MGEIDDTKSFAVNGDGTIVRYRTCSHCGKQSTSSGEYCEFCGKKLPKTNVIKGVDYEKVPKRWEVILWYVAVLLCGFPGVFLSFWYSSVVEYDDMLYYRYNKKTRRWGIGALVLSVVSTIIWAFVCEDAFCIIY